MAIVDEPRAEHLDAAASEKAHSSMVRTLVPIVALYLVAVALYAVLGRRQLVPLVTPDEFRYQHFARAVANGDGFTWFGGHQAFGAKLFIYMLAPAWIL